MVESPDFESLLAYAPAPGLLEGRVIAITGAADGIGRAVALAAAKLGARLLTIDRNRRGLESLRDALTRDGAAAPEMEVMDLAAATTVDYRELAGRIEQEFGRLDGLLNNAGWIGALAPFEHVEPQTFGRVMAVNLAAPFLLTQWCMPLLKKSDDPALVFSLHDSQRAFHGAYGVAKAGQEALLRILADEYHAESETPVRVFGIDTGPVATAERRRHWPGERPDAHPAPASVVGPYLYALGPDAGGLTDVVLRRRAEREDQPAAR